MPVYPGYLAELDAEKAEFIRQLLTTTDVPEPPAICLDCDDLGHYRTADVLFLGGGYCTHHAEFYSIAELTRWFLAARELGVPS